MSERYEGFILTLERLFEVAQEATNRGVRAFRPSGYSVAVEVKDPGSVEPMGVGTDQVESLAGYLVRMAEAEGSHPDKLFFDSVMPEGNYILD